MPEYNVDAVRDRRIQAGIAGTAMASAMGLGFPTYYKKETGQIKWTLSECKFLADFFGETIDSLFFWGESLPKSDYKHTEEPKGDKADECALQRADQDHL